MAWVERGSVGRAPVERPRPDATLLREAVSQAISGEASRKGGILAALRRSPLVGADLDLTRPREEGRTGWI